MTSLTLAIDAMGGDFGPRVTVPAALQALAANTQLHLLLVGDPDTLTPLLTDAQPALSERLLIVPAPAVIASDARPAQAIRNSRGTSMRIALEMVRDGKAQACISAGNTGALMGLAKWLLKPLDGIERPALMTTLPHQQQGKTVVLDLGANVDSDSTMLVQFAIMGAVMAEMCLVFTALVSRCSILSQKRPKGWKRSATPRQCCESRRKSTILVTLKVTNCSPDKTDVMVCDGFVGNVTLKTMEGVVRVFLSLLKSPDGAKNGHGGWVSSDAG